MHEILITFVIGLIAGLVGGMAGIGGSIVMLPGLALLLGYATPDRAEHHLYMASAMLVNVVVAYFSKVQHARQGAVRPDLVRPILASMCFSIVLGVVVVNFFEGTIAKNVLVVFILTYCLFNLYSAVRRLPEPEPHQQRGGVVLLVVIGSLTGFMAGFLGIGGGIVMIPMLQLIARVPLRQSIAASAAVMWVTAIIGSITKLSLLHTHGQHWQDALAIAAPMGLGAVVGARFGAWATHKLRLPFLKIAISLILGASAVRLALPTGRAGPPGQGGSSPPPAEPGRQAESPQTTDANP
ncbi:MAG: sulfite exporter TauE/SafE family protein [Phycisphaerales bacterium]